MKRIVGLTGYATSGKDLVGAILVELFGGRCVNFAAGLREAIEAAIVSGVWPPGVPLSAADLADLTVEEVWAKPTTPRMRVLLQWWGTDYRRAENPDYWVNRVRRMVADGQWYVTDVRFPNEVEMIRAAGGEVWRIVRPGIERMGHTSESIIDTITPDRTIVNDSDVDTLCRRVMLCACASQHPSER